MDNQLRSVIHNLESRLAALETERAASGLMHRYAACLDDPDPDRLALLFTADGTLRTSRGIQHGRSEIAEFFRSARHGDPSEKRHFICQPHLTTDSTGLVQLDCYFGYTARGDHRSGVGWGTYSARIRSVAAEALFESLTIAVHVGSDLEQGWPR